MLMMLWQISQLTREINDLEREAMRVRTRLSNYKSYAGRLGGNTTLFAGNISGLSSELIPRATLFARFSDDASSMEAGQQMMKMKSIGMIPAFNDPMMQRNYEMNAFAQLKQQSLQAIKQREVDAMNEIEKEIELELNSIEHSIKEKTKMKESCAQRISTRIDDFVPKFGGG